MQDCYNFFCCLLWHTQTEYFEALINNILHDFCSSKLLVKTMVCAGNYQFFKPPDGVPVPADELLLI